MCHKISEIPKMYLDILCQPVQFKWPSFQNNYSHFHSRLMVLGNLAKYLNAQQNNFNKILKDFTIMYTEWDNKMTLMQICS